MDELERALAFIREIRRRCAERAVPFRFGTAFFNETLNRVYDLNFLQVDVDASAHELAAEAERVQAGLGHHRKLKIDDQAVGGRLETDFRTLGWTVERHLVMPHLGAVPDVDISLVDEVDRLALEPVWAESIRSEPFGKDEEVVGQLVDHKRVVADAVPTRYFAAVLEGAPVSYCELYSDGHTAQIEAVMTLEPYRRRGFGKAVVTKALAEARAADNSLVFLVADADDWPRELYGKLGFKSVGLKYELLRELTSGPPA
jgi:ribosomal protein S18 acetylase RimI-like enzyme